jgi:hypothetical protein
VDWDPTRTAQTLQKPPPGVRKIEVCPVSGGSPTDACPNPVALYVQDRDADRPPCTAHRRVAMDTRTGNPAAGGTPARFLANKTVVVLPAEYAEWEASLGRARPAYLYAAAGKPLAPREFRISEPGDGDVFIFEPGYDPRTQSVELKGLVEPAVEEVAWLVNDGVFARSRRPYTCHFPLRQGTYTIRMVHMGSDGKTDLESPPIGIEVR